MAYNEKHLVKLADLKALGTKQKEVADALAARVDTLENVGSQANVLEGVKLNGIAAGANKYVHPTHTAAASGLYKTTVDEEGHVTATTPVTKDDITNLGIPAQDTTYGNASAEADGLMAAADKSKLDGMIIATDSEVSEMLAEVYGE